MGEKIIKNGWWGKSEIIIRCREDDYIDKERRKGVKMDFKNVKGKSKNGEEGYVENRFNVKISNRRYEGSYDRS